MLQTSCDAHLPARWLAIVPIIACALIRWPGMRTSPKCTFDGRCRPVASSSESESNTSF
jgi:hypothetical protein